MKTRWRTKKLRLILLSVIALTIVLGVYLYGLIHEEARVAVTADLSPELAGLPTLDSVKSGGVTTVKRKNIYDVNLKELALSFLISSVYVKPLELHRDQGAIAKLSDFLGIKEGELSRKVASEKSFVWVARNVAEDRAAKIRNLQLSGVYLIKEEVRLYPNGRHGGYVIGFAKGEQGLAGIETQYDNVLMGSSEAGGDNLEAAGISRKELANRGGASLILSLDLRVQTYLEKRLTALIEKADARSGMAVIMAVDTGEILAMANTPGYDANYFWRSADFERRNRVISEAVMPGALIGAFVMAAEINAGNVPDFVMNSEEVAEKIILPKLYKRAVGAKQHLANVYWQETGSGAYWSAPEKDFTVRLSASKLELFAEKIGLTGKLAIDLPVYGVGNADNGRDLSLTNRDFSATPMHLLTAFSRVLNGGRMVAPHLLKDIWLEQEGRQIPTKFKKDESGFGPDQHQMMVRLFNELTPKQVRNAILIESLTPEDSGEDEVVDSLELSGGARGELGAAENEILTPKGRYTNLLLGAVPAEKPEVALVLVLDGSIVDQTAASIGQQTVRQIMTKALVWHRVTKTSDTPESRLQEEELFTMWSTLHNGAKRGGREVRKKARKMPNVKGLSLRKALQLLEDYDLHLRVVGSGGVVIQQPRAGESFREGDDGLLELAVKK